MRNYLDCVIISTCRCARRAQRRCSTDTVAVARGPRHRGARLVAGGRRSGRRRQPTRRAGGSPPTAALPPVQTPGLRTRTHQVRLPDVPCRVIHILLWHYLLIPIIDYDISIVLKNISPKKLFFYICSGLCFPLLFINICLKFILKVFIFVWKWFICRRICLFAIEMLGLASA